MRVWFHFLVASLLCVLVSGFSLNCKDHNKCRQLLDRIDLARLQMYDRLGDIRDDVFDSWQESHLKEWLECHDIASATATKVEELRDAAKEHKDALAADIKHYLAHAKKTASPTLEKGKKHFQHAGDVLFEQAVDAWDDVRLKAYLAARGVTSQVERSTDDLRKLVKAKSNELAQKDIIGAWTFETWSDKDLKQAVEKLGKSAKGTRNSLISTLQNAADDAQSFLQEQKAGFESWPTNDLEAYLEKCGVPVHEIKHSKKDLLKLANQQHRLFTRGSTETTVEKIHRHACAIACQTWIHIKRAAIAGYLKAKQWFQVLYRKAMTQKAKYDL